MGGSKRISHQKRLHICRYLGFVKLVSRKAKAQNDLRVGEKCGKDIFRYVQHEQKRKRSA